VNIHLRAFRERGRGCVGCVHIGAAIAGSIHEYGFLLPRFGEDFAIDPLKEFSKIAEVMSVSLDLGRLRVVPPRAKSYGYLAAKHRVPQFREFIAGLSEEAKQRIGKFGYEL